MQVQVEEITEQFVDRRENTDRRDTARENAPERRQFRATNGCLNPEAAELETAVNSYKGRHRRRFINFDELLEVIYGLGYSK